MSNIKGICKLSSLFVFIFLVALTNWGFITPEAKAAGTNYYVATNGNDSWNGTSPTFVSGTTGPFKTIQKAASLMQPGDTCIIRGGTYPEEVIPANSGTSENRIIFKPYPGESVTISGTDRVDSASWIQHSGSIYKKQITMDLGDRNQVFIGGNMAQLARWPNTSSDLWNPTWAAFDEVGSNYVKDADLIPTDGYYTGATITYMPTDNFISNSKIITSYTGGKLYASSSYGYTKKGQPYYLTNKLELLDTQNEWFYDSGTTTLYMWFPGGNPLSDTVSVKKRIWGFNLTNKSYITVQGLNFFGTAATTEGGTGNVFDGINATYVDHYDSNTNGWASHRDDSGFVLGGSYNEIKNSTIAWSHSNGVTIFGNNNRLVNNLIHDCNYGINDTAPIRVFGDSHLVSYNTAFNSSRGIILLKNGISKSIIEHNHLYNAGLLSTDLGIIYAVATDGQNTEIRYNILHDNFSHTKPNGIYLDNGSSNFIVHHNLVYGIDSPTGIGTNINGPTNFNLLYNNTFPKGSEIGGGSSTIFVNDMYGTWSVNNILNDSSSYAETSHTNYTGSNAGFAGANDFHLAANSPNIDAGEVIDGITNGYVGSKPDIGAFEYGAPSWKAGHDFTNPPNPTFSKIYPLHRNRTYNSGFEVTNLIPWTRTYAKTAAAEYSYSHQTSNANARTGFYGLKLETVQDGVEQIIKGLTPNTTYDLSGWAKVTDSSEVRIGVKDYGGNDVYSSSTGSTWKRVDVRFTTGPQNTTATIYGYKTSGSNYAYIDDFGVVYSPEQPKEIIVDNTQAEATGAWASSTYYPNFYGADYVTSPSGGSGADKMKWKPKLSVAGNYKVYIWLPNGNEFRATNAPFKVSYSGGLQTYYIDQRPTGGSWVLLGTHYFEAGQTGYVELTNQANGQYVVADAVKFEKVDSVFELEDLVTVASGATESDIADVNCSNGKCNNLNATAVGNSVTYAVYASQPGTYNVKVRLKRDSGSGTFQLSIDGVNLGVPVDVYNLVPSYQEYDMGQITFATAGNKIFRFTVAGKNLISTGYKLMPDYMKLK
ncbi:hypothetical protein LOZ80_36910 [Paenibacillus sp. HWE-109]|uniref:golvesin C-terminal-like domain-containing protein n=1 Tax=Paenibacillus sp. HWE-109 TaxID=1306526 RepID=UPI001EDF6091|nr:right-handed parallel beta-helix repeat-containing protein [Paenibacillus sp. HWE-109]UKS26983.1 hypothetical protein LOZ80_36910 [Paenibacillus sp. HWE-109]